MSNDATGELVERVKDALFGERPLSIHGGNTKAFYGRPQTGEQISIAGHRGIVSYEPTELVITARSGTPLAEVESTLAEKGQFLAFEPPHFGPGATIGGAIAAGLSGPRRPYAGAARDFVLGVRMINGKGEDLRFGGQVMKNVAGYDVSRLMVGSMGTLGVILEVSLKVLPAPRLERTLAIAADTLTAIELQKAWARTPSSISATCHSEDCLHVRLSGSAKGVASAQKKLGGDEVEDGSVMWSKLKEHEHAFFADGKPLWRVSVPPTTPPLGEMGECLMEWSGALRWTQADVSPQELRGIASQAGGHAMLFRGGDRDQVFHPLDEANRRLQMNLKSAFDPKGIFNPGRMYEGI